MKYLNLIVDMIYMSIHCETYYNFNSKKIEILIAFQINANFQTSTDTVAD